MKDQTDFVTKKKMRVTVLGSGTSTGVPPIGLDDPVFLNGDPKNRRLRAGMLIRDPELPIEEAKAFIIDCGPDYHHQALKHRINRLDGVLLTHTHFDHVGGIDDLRIYNFRQGHALPLFGKSDHLMDLQQRFSYIFNPPIEGGGVASFDLHEVTGPFEFLGFKIVPLPVFHGSAPILGFRFGDFTFITDASLIPDETMKLVEGTKTLILNALRPKEHSTHFSLSEAVEKAKEINPQQTYFIHMTHLLEHHSTNETLPDNMELSYDGLEFDIEMDSVL